MGGCSLRVSGVEVSVRHPRLSLRVPVTMGSFRIPTAGKAPHGLQGLGFRVQDKMQANRAGNMATRHELVQAPKP